MSDPREKPGSSLLHNLKNQGLFIVLDAPTQGIDFSFDLASWRTGPNFKGLKFVPPGPHLATVTTIGAVASRSGVFKWFDEGATVVCRYRSDEESLEAVDDKDLETRLRENVLELDRYLGPYPCDHHRSWTQLTSHVQPSLLRWVVPPSITTFDSMTPIPAFNFSHCDTKHSYPKDSTPAERTRYSLDKSKLLESLRDPVGELQIAWLMLVCSHNFEAFEHWRKLLHVFASSVEAIPLRPQLFSDFMRALRWQLEHCPREFFSDLFGQENVLKVYMSSLLRNVKEFGPEAEGERAGLSEESARLARFVEERIGVTVSDNEAGDEDEDEEYKPVVVSQD